MLIVTWLTILINNPFSMSWFAFHPPLQVLAMAFFGYGSSPAHPLHPPPRLSLLYPTIFPYPALPSVPLYLIYIGILTLQPTSLAQPKAKASAFNRHEFFMFYLGLPSIFLGSLAIVVNKSVNGYPHFTTWHGVSRSKARHTYNLLILIHTLSLYLSSPWE